MVRQTRNTSSLDRRRLLGAAIGTAFLAPAIANAQTPQQVGSVEDIKGEAFADSRDRGGTDRLVPSAPCQVQGAAPRCVYRDPQNVDWKNSKVQVARDGKGRLTQPRSHDPIALPSAARMSAILIGALRHYIGDRAERNRGGHDGAADQ